MLGGSVPHVIIDVAILLLPINLLRKLHMKLPRK